MEFNPAESSNTLRQDFLDRLRESEGFKIAAANRVLDQRRQNNAFEATDSDNFPFNDDGTNYLLFHRQTVGLKDNQPVQKTEFIISKYDYYKGEKVVYEKIDLSTGRLSYAKRIENGDYYRVENSHEAEGAIIKFQKENFPLEPEEGLIQLFPNESFWPSDIFDPKPNLNY